MIFWIIVLAGSLLLGHMLIRQYLNREFDVDDLEPLSDEYLTPSRHAVALRLCPRCEIRLERCQCAAMSEATPVDIARIPLRSEKEPR